MSLENGMYKFQTLSNDLTGAQSGLYLQVLPSNKNRKALFIKNQSFESSIFLVFVNNDGTENFFRLELNGQLNLDICPTNELKVYQYPETVIELLTGTIGD